jgi:hypothetical protein
MTERRIRSDAHTPCFSIIVEILCGLRLSQTDYKSAANPHRTPNLANAFFERRADLKCPFLFFQSAIL